MDREVRSGLHGASDGEEDVIIGTCDNIFASRRALGVRSMPATKKLLVAFDPKQPDARASDFLIPWNREGQRRLLSLESGKESALGMVIFTGRSLTENDLFAKLVDSGAVIGDVEFTLALLRSYVEALQPLKIGNLIRIGSTDKADGTDVDLDVVASSHLSMIFHR